MFFCVVMSHLSINVFSVVRAIFFFPRTFILVFQNFLLVLDIIPNT